MSVASLIEITVGPFQVGRRVLHVGRPNGQSTLTMQVFDLPRAESLARALLWEETALRGSR